LALASARPAPSRRPIPTKEIQGIIQWGAGGSTDTVMRAVTPHAEKDAGRHRGHAEHDRRGGRHSR
jgi:tripartite-type tricarboxylate transporter receptor subunit TctC